MLRDIINSKKSIYEVSCEVLEKLKTLELRDFFGIIWCIWRHQNDKVWRAVELAATMIVNMARELMQSWCNIRSRQGDLD